MALLLKDFPQLRLIAWNMRDNDTLEEKEAFSLYERNWRFVDQASLDEAEKILIERLIKQYGCGVLNV